MQTKLKRNLAICMAAAAVSISAVAQNPGPKYYVGLGAGLHSNTMKISDLDTKKFPKDESMSSGVITLWGEVDFLRNHSLAIRPQFSFLHRGGKLTNIDESNWSAVEYATGDKVDDMYYKLNASYFDFRVPVLWQFGNDDSRIRPYVGIAPVFGFVTGGDVSYMMEFESKVAEGYRIDLNKGNMKGTYFAFAPTVGLKFYLPAAGVDKACFIGVEASYEIGLTNTYGKDKKGDAIDVVANRNKALKGSRKFRGFELNVTVGIPLSVFAPKTEAKPAPVVSTPVIPERPVVEKPKPKACYTLEEIEEMIDNRESVAGKTICAIDAINFDFNKSTIKRNSYSYLQRLAKTLIRTNAKVDVKGHTDNVGTDSYNMELSKNRAKAVHAYLIRQGVKAENLSYSYYGASMPLTDNDTDEGRTMNRRVEFEILK